MNDEAEVAPHTGAWIETNADTASREIQLVAPHTGAWIETAIIITNVIIYQVAPHTGAWIETCDKSRLSESNLASHPTRVRGLKHIFGLVVGIIIRSHPTRVRGLKHAPRQMSMSWLRRTPHGCVD